MSYIVYHNNRCSKSRAAVAYLTEKGVDFEVVEYLKTPLTKEILVDLVQKLKMPMCDLIRTNEAIYKENFKRKVLSDDEWMDILLGYPKLMQRPIVVKGDKAVIARPTELIDTL